MGLQQKHNYPITKIQNRQYEQEAGRLRDSPGQITSNPSSDPQLVMGLLHMPPPGPPDYPTYNLVAESPPYYFIHYIQ